MFHNLFCNRLLALSILLFLGVASATASSAGMGTATKPEPSAPVTKLEQITVEAQPINPTRQEGDLLYTGSEITPEGLELAGLGGLSSVYQAFSILPGLNPELTDPTGIGGTEMRLRGIKSLFTGLTVEGLPNYGIMSVGPRDYLYDLENMSALKLYRGATPTALSSGTGNRGGTIALNFARPSDDFGLQLEQSLGSNALSRSFFRLDSGSLPSLTKFFISASHTEADKWKGAGEIGGRNHLTLGLSQKISETLDAELFYNDNNEEQDLYQGLNYNQARHISSHADDDYLEELTGTPADVNYYKYHHSRAENHDLMTIINYRPAEGHCFSLKPYYSTEDKKWLDGAADKYVEAERYGAKLEYVGNWAGTLISTGYWYENHDLEKYVRKNKIDNLGRNYAGWAYLAENRGSGQIHTPYLQLGRQFGPFSGQVGIKYFSYKEPASIAYLSNKSTPATYNQALADNLGEDPAMSLKAMRFQKWLPSISLGCQASPDLDFYLNYGRNFMRPYAYVPLASIYSSNRAKFLAADLTLQDIYDGWKLETSDNFDLGCRWQQRWFSLAPTLFYARHHDLLFVAYDERVGLNYHQNIGDATIYGAELECNLYATDNLMFYINPSYTRATFDDDLVSGGQRLATDGNDLPDTPRWLVKAGLIYKYKNLSIAPSLKYVDQRYGDIANQEKVDAYTVVNLNLGYKLQNFYFLREAGIDLEFSNLLDKKYVGSIRADDDGFKASQYYAGIPLTTVCKFSGKF
ncbi:MAG: TonB-dependent receptor [Deltaproteobacteria bacterium]|nr:TonB-dependent receptor [Deltaproteobacteria bacterium]